MDINEILTQMYRDRHKHMTEHEIDFIEAMYKKIVYGRRNAEGTEEANIRRMYKIFIARSFK